MARHACCISVVREISALRKQVGIYPAAAILKAMSDPTASKPKPRRGRLRRLLKLASITALVFIAAATLGLMWAYDQRLKLVNDALRKLGPITGSAAAVEFDRMGNFEMRGLEIDEPAAW